MVVIGLMRPVCLPPPTPKWIETCPIFMYRAYGKFDFTFIQSCFIHANTNNPIILAWCFSMEQLWKKEKKLLHYFQLHLMLKALVYTNSLAKEEFLKMPAISRKRNPNINGLHPARSTLFDKSI